MEGIYCYTDLKTDKIVYIGKDSHINQNKRHISHLSSSKYGEQQINRVLQNNPNRYQYKVLKSWQKGKFHKKLTSVLEILYIKRYNPLFNFTKGGDGTNGYHHSKESRRKRSIESLGEKNHFYGKKHSTETLEKMSKIKTGKKFSKETCIKMSKSQSVTGYFRVGKVKCKDCKQGFRWRYTYVDDLGKKKQISSTDINKLEQKVKSKGLEWIIL